MIETEYRVAKKDLSYTAGVQRELLFDVEKGYFNECTGGYS